MSRLYTIFAVVCLMLALNVEIASGYVIDADLSDWQVTPFVDWEPGGTADYIMTDGINLYDCLYYHEEYDFEAMYFDDDEENFYFAVVSSYPIGIKGGDLGIDLNSDFAVSSHGSVTGLEYAVQLSFGNLGVVLADPLWSDTLLHQWLDGWQGSPYYATDGEIIGMATVAIEHNLSMEDGTYILEVAVPREIFPTQYKSGDVISCHISHWCGNDSINLNGIINIPEPATLLLFSAGVIFVNRIRWRQI